MDYWSVLWLLVILIWVWYAFFLVRWIVYCIKDYLDKRKIHTTKSWEQTKKELEEKKVNNSIIINCNWFRYFWPKSLNGWFFRISGNDLVYSAVEKHPAPTRIKMVNEVWVSSSFFEKNIRHLVFETRVYNFLRGNWY